MQSSGEHAFGVKRLLASCRKEKNPLWPESPVPPKNQQVEQSKDHDSQDGLTNNSQRFNKPINQNDLKALQEWLTQKMQSMHNEHQTFQSILQHKIIDLHQKIIDLHQKITDLHQEIKLAHEIQQKSNYFNKRVKKARVAKNSQPSILQKEFDNCLHFLERCKRECETGESETFSPKAMENKPKRTRDNKRRQIRRFNASRNRLAIWWLYFRGIRVSSLMNITYQNLDEIFDLGPHEYGLKDTTTQIVLATAKNKPRQIQKIGIAKYVHQRYSFGEFNLYKDYQQLKRHKEQWCKENVNKHSKDLSDLWFFSNYHHLNRRSNRSYLNETINTILQHPEISELKQPGRKLTTHSFRVHYILNLLKHFNLETAQSFVHHHTVLATAKYNAKPSEKPDTLPANEAQITILLASKAPQKQEVETPAYQEIQKQAAFIEQNKNAIYYYNKKNVVM